MYYISNTKCVYTRRGYESIQSVLKFYTGQIYRGLCWILKGSFWRYRQQKHEINIESDCQRQHYRTHVEQEKASITNFYRLRQLFTSLVYIVNSHKTRIAKAKPNAGLQMHVSYVQYVAILVFEENTQHGGKSTTSSLFLCLCYSWVPDFPVIEAQRLNQLRPRHRQIFSLPLSPCIAFTTPPTD